MTWRRTRTAGRAAGRAACMAVVSLLAAACTGDEPGTYDEHLVISGGGTAGIYYGYGDELAAALSDRLGVTAEVLETGGSIENLHELASGSSQLAFSAADAAGDAVTGRPPFDVPLRVRAVARVYDDFVHLVVKEDSDIADIEDLRGRRVSLGADGSGTELIARRLLLAAGVDPGDVDNAAMGIDESVAALRSGTVEAFFWSGGLSTPGVKDLAEDVPIRLVDLWELVEPVRREYGGGYRHGVVPQGTYGLHSDVPTMAVPNYLLVDADADADLVYDVARVLFEQRAQIARQVPAAALLDRSRAIYTASVELHPGALRYYREVKL